MTATPSTSYLSPEISAEPTPPFGFVGVQPDENGSPVPEPLRDRVMIDVIHDGNAIPRVFWEDDAGKPFDTEEIARSFRVERDWGAETVASALASALHLEGYYRVNIARTLLDFGRFPGITRPGADHMHRHAITAPFSTWLSHAQKQSLLEDYYDVISSGMDAAIRGKLLKIAIHSYDEKNFAATRRPAVSVLSRSYGHTVALGQPMKLFDPACPHEIAEVTADRILRSRIALTLEEKAISTADNYPYSLPEGSVEVRSQVWHFFRHVQRRFNASSQADLPPEDEAAQRVWHMLLDTNLRSAESDALRSYLHMFRRAPEEQRSIFERARTYYETIVDYIETNRTELVASYRTSIDRPSSLLIEVRKDLIWQYENGEPIGPRPDNAQLIARTIAQGVSQYLTQDRDARAQAAADLDSRFVDP